ncbi:MAG: NUDIX domain-containing protein [Nanoarchaeota archaeon]|nr:NUDIX domain-containing protein [Nanoarchaeota archaeon]
MGDTYKASCLVLNNDKILLVREKAEGCWQLPGSIVNQQDVPENAALSQTETICGIKARIIQLFGLYEYQKDDKNYQENVFEADLPPETSDELKPDEKFEAKWASLAEAKKEKLCSETKLVFDDL